MKLKRTFCLIVSLCLMLGAFSMPAAAADVTRSYERETQLAYALEALGLFQGYSGTNLGLEDAPTRTQALVMMLRLMGLEQDAQVCGAEGTSHVYRAFQFGWVMGIVGVNAHAVRLRNELEAAVGKGGDGIGKGGGDLLVRESP